ncbi:MAG: hypothetical protein ACYTHJ_03695 [Planctomycetota bacterium]|jgi:hypothetical protein
MSPFQYFLIGAALWAVFCGAAHGQCDGEAPAISPCLPRVIPGDPGVHTVVMDATNSGGGFQMACTPFPTGNNVWFEITPTVTGELTFSSCHPATSFDTIIQPWKATSDCEFPQRLDELCVDDSSLAECDNGCMFQSGRVKFSVNAGETYLFEVGAFNENSGGCTACLGINVTICDLNSTPPVAMLSSPSSFSCQCNNWQIIGTASDLEDGFADFTLEYRPASGGNWTTISEGTTPVINGVLANWSAVGLAQGYYFLRLSVRNACGKESTDIQVVWLDGQFDTLAMGWPTTNGIYGGTMCFDGTANDHLCFDYYTLEYRPFGGGAYSPIGAGVFNTPVTNNPLASWNSLTVPDGTFEVRFSGVTACGNSASLTQPVVVDNTPPTVQIESPMNCEYVDGEVQISGSVADANLAGWTLQISGGDIPGWQTLNNGVTNVSNAVLATWNASAHPACAYVLRLIATDLAVVDCDDPHQSTHYITFNVGYCGDFDADDDGDVDLIDFGWFQDEFTGLLP